MRLLLSNRQQGVKNALRNTRPSPRLPSGVPAEGLWEEVVIRQKKLARGER